MRLLTFTLIFISTFLFSQNISKNEAKTVATNYYLNKVNRFSGVAVKKIKIKSTTSIKNKNSQTLLYVFNLKSDGYIITSANKNIVPVLAYSNQSNFDFKNVPPAVNYWLNRYKEQTEYILKNNTKSIENNLLWEKYLNNNFNTKDINDTLVEPLVTSKWNQTKFYNALCPDTSAGPDGHSLTGCVATATGQLLYYHRFPESGTGSYSYNCPNFGVISEDFSTANYNFDEMANQLTDYSYSAALLLYHLGVTFDMWYGPDGSAVWNHSVDNSLKTYFKYCPETQYVFRDSTTMNWDSIVAVNLMNKKPLYYAGWEDLSFQSGHAFVCDGYNGANYYHYNWGWGGAYDGWFYSDNLTPAGSQFSYAQEIIKDIYPDTLNYSYPNYCTTNNSLTTSFATITDGSSSLNYVDNANCDWYINPECGKILNIEFDAFDVKENDTLFVYEGADNLSPLMSYYTLGEEPILSNTYNNTVLNPNNGEAYIKFTSDNSNNANGWSLSYSSNYCNYGISITDTTGTITDGSETCNYKQNQNCRWTIEPTEAEAVKITFTEFALDSSNVYDYVKIYKDNTTSSNLIADLRYGDTPNEIYIPSGTVVVKFATYTNSSGQGWSFNYEKTELSELSANSFSIYHKIYPNPINNTSTLEFVSNTIEKGICSISDINGKIISKKEITTTLGVNKLNINDIIKLENSGVYFIKYVSNKLSFIDKLIVK